jgi:hypothetical protein
MADQLRKSRRRSEEREEIALTDCCGRGLGAPLLILCLAGFFDRLLRIAGLRDFKGSALTERRYSACASSCAFSRNSSPASFICSFSLMSGRASS